MQKKYYRDKFKSCKGNSSKTWKITNNIMGSESKNKPKSFSIMHQSNMVTNDNEISEIFNEYFINVSNNLSLGISNNNINPYLTCGNEQSNPLFSQSALQRWC